MQPQPLRISAGFKKKAIGAILSLALFVTVYLLLIAMSIALTIACCYAGIQIIIAKPMIITLLLGLGLASMGILVLIFLLKFITKKNTIDQSHLVQITQAEEPVLFAFINTIAAEVKTTRPKKIFLTADVNASVFYNSTFWSMFMPVKKNLQVGMGLMNAVSQSECKAILAHEFGHFSQSSMKVGSYVYNVNKIIYNMLYDNESYLRMASSWAGASSYIAIFVRMAVKIIQGIQWLLQKVYAVVNVNYLGLSREMEFHADAVAASVAGSRPLITSLSRLTLTNQSYTTVLNYYSNKIEEGVSTQNIYPQQLFVLRFLAQEDGLDTENGFPLVNLSHTRQYQQSRLIIKDQWASHPETTDRIAALEKLNIAQPVTGDGPAIQLFNKPAHWQQVLTTQLFSAVTYQKEVTIFSAEAFAEAFTSHYRQNAFSKLFNHYYDQKNPTVPDFSSLEAHPQTSFTTEELFSDKNREQVNNWLALEQDIALLKQLAEGDTSIKSFDYNGEKYRTSHAGTLADTLQKEADQLQAAITENDRHIYQHFLSLASQQHKTQELQDEYEALSHQEAVYGSKEQTVQQLAGAFSFIEASNQIDVIQQNLNALRPLENNFKKLVKELLELPVIQPDITESTRDAFNRFLSKEYSYFDGAAYNQVALHLLFTSLEQYRYLHSRSYFNVKQSLLRYLEALHINATGRFE